MVYTAQRVAAYMRMRNKLTLDFPYLGICSSIVIHCQVKVNENWIDAGLLCMYIYNIMHAGLNIALIVQLIIMTLYSVQVL